MGGCDIRFLLLITLALLPNIYGQSHEWVAEYGDCSAPCNGGIEFLNKVCYSTGVDRQKVAVTYCEVPAIPELLAPKTRPCNSQPCSMCDREYTGATGVLTSPYWPEKNAIQQFCRLKIQVEKSKRILIAFQEFILEGLQLETNMGLTEKSVCTCGNLVELSDMTSSHRVTSYCGTKQTFSWVSESNEVQLDFVTDSNLVFNRFEATYSTLDAVPSCYSFIDITSEVNLRQGFITSDNFPDYYNNDLHCEYVLHADPHHRIVLYFDQFNLEPSTSCTADKLMVEDLLSRRSETYCGIMPQFAWMSDSNEVRIQFLTDDSQKYQGFIIGYEVNDRPPASEFNVEMIDVSGTFTSPHFPAAYPADAEVHYYIQVPADQYILIQFRDFWLESEDSFSSPFTSRVRRSTSTLSKRPYETFSCPDKIVVKDLYYSNFLLEEYCGHQQEFTWISRSNAVIVTFTSDSDEEFRGFRATYRSLQRTPPPEWELIFRNVAGNNEDTYSRWIDSRAYGYFPPDIKSTQYRGLYKSDLMLDWADIGIKRIKINLYKDGVGVKQFRFYAEESTNNDDWFTCENLIYSPYTDLRECDFTGKNRREFSLPFEIEDGHASDSNCSYGKVWLDLEDVSSGVGSCYYETTTSGRPYFAYSSRNTAGDTSTGEGIGFADVFGIFIQRDCHDYVDLKASDTSTIKSRRSNDLYIKDEICDITVQLKPDERIFLQFSNFILQQGDCNQDYLEIEDVLTGAIDKVCGTQEQVTWTSSGNSLLLRFRTDSTISFTGFETTVSKEFRDTEDCSAVNYDEQGILATTNTPIPTSSFFLEDCSNVIHVHPSQKIVLTFNEFDYQFDDCPQFRINDRADDNGGIDVYGNLYPFSWTSQSNEFIVSYCALTPYRNYLVYNATYRSISTIQAAAVISFKDAERPGVFSWPQTTATTTDSFLIIRSHPNDLQRVILTISDFVLSEQSCSSFMKIIDTTTQRQSMYCGTEYQPFTWTSDANEVLLHFKHNSNEQHQVNANYRSYPRTRFDYYSFYTLDSTTTVRKRGAEHLLAGGSFTSPGYPEKYPNNHNYEEYLIHAPPSFIVVVTFKAFSLEDETVSSLEIKCEHDYVELYDVLGEPVVFCGTKTPFAWVSTGNEVLVKFVSDSHTVKTGFSAEYHFQPRLSDQSCGGLFTTDVGNFFSPGYPHRYGNNIVCQYRFQTAPGKHFTIKFLHLDIEDHVDCEKDFINLFDVSTNKEKSFCGFKQNAPMTWESDSNLVFAKFKSNDHYTFSGFLASYEVKDIDKASACVQSFEGITGHISSPWFPLPYPNDITCVYTIKVAKDFFINLAFEVFDLEEKTADTDVCGYDYLEVSNPSNTQETQLLCGKKNAIQIGISNNIAILTFHSDFIKVGQGFYLTYSQTDQIQQVTTGCDKQLTTLTGEFTSPNHPLNYPLNIDCVYTIVVDPIYKVVLTFDPFNVEFQDTCKYDFLQVIDKAGDTEKKFCGRYSDPLIVQSTNNKVVIKFHSDNMTPSSGFRARYESWLLPTSAPVITGCPHVELVTPTGILSSPNFPRNYDLNIDCSIRIVLPKSYVCRIHFETFDVEDEETCNYDFVKLTSYPGKKEQYFCGHRNAFDWTSSGNICMLDFHSDDYITKGGFKATYEAVEILNVVPISSECIQTLGDKSGAFTSPHYPDDYDLLSECITTIFVPYGNIIEIEFNDFEIEYEDDCSWDFVQIIDLPSYRTSPKYCGVLDKFTYISETNKVQIILSSDEYVSAKGYSASYAQISYHLK
ncbi:cubilin-like [Anneissia japonica]|uniref:cubilin-like n=1 Tax=Anneissia japonica TaxID=1529436 RepID=UPI001425A94A|nr:cubilin-like [Anneissia japonica]